MLFAISWLLQTRFDIDINHTLKEGGGVDQKQPISIFTKTCQISRLCLPIDMRLRNLMSALSIGNYITFS